MGEIEKKEEKSEVFSEKIRSWIGRNNKKLNNILGKEYAVHVQRGYKSISAAFIEYLKNLSNELEASKDVQVSEETGFKE